jgi:hypothetical protein
MTITVAEMAKLESKYPLRKGIMMNWIRACPLLDILPFENVESLNIHAARATVLPTPAFRMINDGYSKMKSDVDYVSETVYPFGGDIEIDVIYDDLPASNFLEHPRAFNVRMASEAMGYVFKDYCINGDHASDSNGFEGLKKRVSNMPSRQSVRASSTTDVIAPTASTANANRFFNKWEEAAYKANGGDFQAILMNEGLYWGFGQVLRYLSISGGPLLDVTKDSLEREFLTYKGARMIDMGLKRDQSTEIIPKTETAEDAGADATSAYFVPFNIRQGVTGIQLKPMKIYDPLSGGEEESKPSKLIRVEWVVGLAGFGSNGHTRLHNIENPDSWT